MSYNYKKYKKHKTLELLKDTLKQITENSNEWIKFLNTASNMYKYSSLNQILIYAQNPNAIACTDLSTWNKIGKWINKGSKGIAIINNSDDLYNSDLKYIFDISNTSDKRDIDKKDIKKYYIWNISNNYNHIINKFKNFCGYKDNKETIVKNEDEFAKEIIAVIDNVINNTYNSEFYNSISNYINNTNLEKLSNNEIQEIFKDILISSCQYMVLKRCSVKNPEKYIDINKFNNINLFNTRRALTSLQNQINSFSYVFKVRSGKVRILLGSTQKCGAGTNIQDRLVALHHLDCPWRPSDLEQREGRILRYGNRNPEVSILRYVTENTFDAYNWSIVETKQKFISQIMTSKTPMRSMEDIDETALSYAEVKALATGDPRIKEKMDLDVEVSKLKVMFSNYQNQKYEMEDKLVSYYPTEIAKVKETIELMKKDCSILNNNIISEDNFNINIDGTNYNKRKDAGNALYSLCKSYNQEYGKLCVGNYRGFDLYLYTQSSDFKIDIKNNLAYTVTLENSEIGNIVRINNVINSIEDKLQANIQKLENLKKQKSYVENEVKKPFPKEKEYKEKVKRLSILNSELNKDNTKSNIDKSKNISIVR